MRLSIVAVGRLKKGPERELVERYRERVDGLARSLGFSSLDLAEIPEGRSRREPDRKAEEAEAIRARVGPAATIAFDECGRSLTSEELAAQVRAWSDGGRTGLACAIGGPDGFHPAIRAEADLVLSFGKLTLPHQLVRVLVIEQLYRCLTILAGHPYHRGGGDAR